MNIGNPNRSRNKNLFLKISMSQWLKKSKRSIQGQCCAFPEKVLASVQHVSRKIQSTIYSWKISNVLPSCSTSLSRLTSKLDTWKWKNKFKRCGILFSVCTSARFSSFSFQHHCSRSCVSAASFFPSNSLLMNSQTMIDGCTCSWWYVFWFYSPFCYHFHELVVPGRFKKKKYSMLES